MYAAVYFQAATSNIFLFRDPFGMNPLVYHIDNKCLICTSEIKA